MEAKGSALKLLVLLPAIQATSLMAQSKGSNEADFRLTLSVTAETANAHPAVLQMIVKLTNISHHMIYESTCAAFGALYQVVATRDGEPIPEAESDRKHREEMQHAESIGLVCDGSNPGRRLKPGESYDDPELVNVRLPGMYRVYVERLSFKRNPSDPSKSTSTIVKSNLITYISADP
jgi:hypothetical protein